MPARDSSHASRDTLELRFAKFSDFVKSYSSRVSLGGMFVITDEPRPVGSTVALEAKLSDGYRLVHGLGEVVWIRLSDEGPENPAGMALRFQKLDESGRELILKILEEQVKGGGAPFDLDEVPEGAIREPLTGGGRRRAAAASAAAMGREERFDFGGAPWGDRLPELPDEILGGEVGDRDIFDSVEGPAAASVGEPDEVAVDDGAADDAFDFADDEPAAAAIRPMSMSPAAEIDFDSGVYEAAEEAAGAVAADPEPGVTGAPETSGAADDLFAFDLGDDEATEAPGPVAVVSPTFDEGPAWEDEPAWEARPEPPVAAEEPVHSVPRGDELGLSDVDSELAALERQAVAELPAGSMVPPPAVAAAVASVADRPPAVADRPPTVADRPPAVDPYSFGDPPAPEPARAAARAAEASEPPTAPAAESPPDEDWLHAGPGRRSRLPWVLAALLAVAVVAWFLREPLLGRFVREETPAVAERVGGLQPAPLGAGSEPAADDPALEAADPGSIPPATAVAATAPPVAEPIAEPVAGPVVPDRPARTVESIDWRDTPAGTLVTVSGDGAFAADRFDHVRVGSSPPRELLRLRGIERPPPQPTLRVGSDEVEQVRTGLHDGGVLHVVFDLAAPGVRIVEATVRDGRLHVLLAR